ncbi:hypothetical protein E0Z10_g8521 [Xylaria hypoxylon]|uniref:VOC domain-containing protein n=1 Tax=Xylaria hypoxylon TaxID=37992 RepID=A0A4Z0YM45_9PEZI|nr:hypothetical protein E0Z10_g8521 [Xylaria hypoxylon]
MRTLPYVQVKDLAPSASFYSAVTQPLGLRFISANASSIVYGNPDPVFEVKISANPPKPTRIVLSVSSPSVVSAFHAATRRANPTGNSNILLKDDDGISGESRASATDLEGNIMEIVYLPGYTGSTVRTQSTTKQVTRILDWNLDVATSTVGAARSVAGSVTPSRPGLATVVPTDDESYRIIRRSFTTSTVESSPPQQQQTSKGLSTGAMVGTMLGAVAVGALGAGITYAFIKKDRDRTPRQEFDAPPFQRRATYPEPYPDHQPRYVEMERTVEKVRYPEQYPPGSNNYTQPAYTTRRSQAGSPPVEEVIDDRASRHNSSSRTRDRSASSPRKPLMITEVEHKSNVGSQHPEPSRLLTEAEHRSRVESRHTTNAKSQLHAELFKRHNPAPSIATSKAPSQAPDARSHVSSRSRHRDDDRRSHASSRHRTVRPPRDAEVETYVSARSEKSTSTVRPVKTQTRSKAPSRAASYVSAREIPSPPKETDWKDIVDDDDNASVAPSDSISCIGERPSK